MSIRDKKRTNKSNKKSIIKKKGFFITLFSNTVNIIVKHNIYVQKYKKWIYLC